MDPLHHPASTDREAALAGQIDQLRDAVEAILRTTPEGLSELALIRALQQPPWSILGEIDFRTPAAIYPAHFLLFHTLYRWRCELSDTAEETLEINALRIQIRPVAESQRAELDRADPLQHFYLDLDNYKLETETIDRMIDDFWQGIRRPADAELAFACERLGITCPPESLQAARASFRRLAMRHHPDRGGSTGTLQQLNEAIAVVKQYFQSTTSH